jgi:ABC-type bacteriocin/lantibiotic exporter with double-glycine peptidase domain
MLCGNLRRLLPSMTIVVIAHRKSSVAWTDSGILLKDGKVAVSGPTGELLASAGGIFEMGDALLDTSRQ